MSHGAGDIQIRSEGLLSREGMVKTRLLVGILHWLNSKNKAESGIDWNSVLSNQSFNRLKLHTSDSC